MPVSTERHSGFPVSKWEQKYLRCRYIAHRRKIASIGPAIDASAPPERSHVKFKVKRALQEDRRQVRVIQENLRILDRTMNIMASSHKPTHFTNARSICSSSDSRGENHDIQKPLASSTALPAAPTSFASSPGCRKKLKYIDRPLTAKLKRNTHIVFRWFIQRFGKYVPWWAEINY